MMQLICIDNASLNAWRQNDLTSAVTILLQETQGADHHRLANLALVRARLQEWDLAERDARASIRVQPTILARIAVSIVLGGQGKHASAKQEFNRIFLHHEPKSECLLLLIKSIIILIAGDRDEAMRRVTDLIEACAEADKALCSAVQAQMQLLVGQIALHEQDYEKALRLFGSAGASAPFLKLPELETISLMFGWDFNQLLLSVRQQTCEALYAASQMSKAIESSQTMLEEFRAEIEASVDLSIWLENFTRRCVHHNPDTVREPAPSTFLLPLLSIGNDAVEAWFRGFLDDAEERLSREIKRSAPMSNHNAYANRALVRGRLKKGSEALDDAELSLFIQRSAIGHIAKVIAIIQQGRHELARQEIPKVLETPHSDEHTFLLQVIQSILCSLSGEYDKEVCYITTLTGGDQRLLWLVQANMHLFERNFEPAMKSFKDAHIPAVFPNDQTREMRTISFIFGWKFSGLGIQVQQRKCNSLLDDGKPESVALFLQVMETYRREIVTDVELSEWALEFRRTCHIKLERLGDQAFVSENFDEAVKQYDAVIPLIGDSNVKHALLLKRSDAHLGIGGEIDLKLALKDAEEAINLNSMSPWGHDKKNSALYRLYDYREAAEALNEMISCIASSEDPKSTELKDKGVEPGKTKPIILDVVKQTLDEPRPHLLINTRSLRLCDKEKQKDAFRASPEYKDLVLRPTTGFSVDVAQEVIQPYFRYSMLSHTWEDKGEPTFRDVERIQLSHLTKSFPNMKLQTFCKKAHERGYWWAWSDTCCINKDDMGVLDMSLRSMYQWYSGSSLTIVHLKGVHLQLEGDVNMLLHILDGLLKDFVECRWNKRAWTLQEYFASKAIHFYTEDWAPYLPIDVHLSNANPTNHKNHRAIQRGMELVTKLDPASLAALKPGSDNARQKLRLASTREAARREDVAYSLLGIFKVTISAIYGDDEVSRALGRLLEALLTRSSDVTILAWTGKPSEYNTCLPSEIAVYRESEFLHVPHRIEEAQLASDLNVDSNLSLAESAVRLFDTLFRSPRPGFIHGRLELPCISFEVQTCTSDPNSRGYILTTKFLGKIELRTMQDLSSTEEMILVHPWFRYLLPQRMALTDLTKREDALKLLAALRQPFGALLLAWNHNSFVFQRVATDQLITVQISGDISSEELLEDMSVDVRYIC